MKNKISCKLLVLSWLSLYWVSSSLALAPNSAPEARQGPRFLSYEAVKPLFDLSSAQQIAYQKVLPGPDETYVVFDFELTGLDPKTTKPIEIAAFKFRGTELIETFYTLVDPQEPLIPITQEITGLNDQMLQGQPKSDEALTQFMQFIQGSLLVGHHTFELDIEMLKRETKDLDIPFLKKDFVVWDTRKMASKLQPYYYLRPLNLKALSKRFASPVLPDHSAFYDALATAHVFRGLRRIKKVGFKHRLEKAGGVQSFMEPLIVLSKYFQGFDQTEDGFKRRSYISREIEGIIFLGKAKLQRIEQIAKSYFYGRVKKVIIVLGYQSDIKDKQTVLNTINSYKQPFQPDMDENDLEFAIIGDRQDERIEYLSTYFKNQENSLKNVLIVSHPFFQRRLSLQLQKLKESNGLPLSLNFSFMATKFINLRKKYESNPALFKDEIPRDVLWFAADLMSEVAKVEKTYGVVLPQAVLTAVSALETVLLPDRNLFSESLETAL